jgi:hypothetical protein
VRAEAGAQGAARPRGARAGRRATPPNATRTSSLSVVPPLTARASLSTRKSNPLRSAACIGARISHRSSRRRPRTPRPHAPGSPGASTARSQMTSQSPIQTREPACSCHPDSHTLTARLSVNLRPILRRETVRTRERRAGGTAQSLAYRGPGGMHLVTSHLRPARR